ncbi:hypothetical protein SAMN05421507_108188 [Lentzea jiangxiensis]|uniref:Uncharacterized protein n=2 Tax=Lentzea jiangxiensis TaxID=641025 RepID=A0A1H0SPB6_9PSEU|nr:hypothetical protein SAMN05421507_108188 [Lentzea jiangxiensis]
MLGKVAQQPPSLVRLQRSGAVTTLVRGENGEMLTGNVRADDGTVYYNLNSPTAARAGVWKLPPDNPYVSPRCPVPHSSMDWPCTRTAEPCTSPTASPA